MSIEGKQEPDYRKMLFEEVVPKLGSEYEYPDLFGKYGSTVGVFSPNWEWNYNADNATDEEVLRMIVLTNTHWMKMYDEMYNNLYDHMVEKYGCSFY